MTPPAGSPAFGDESSFALAEDLTAMVSFAEAMPTRSGLLLAGAPESPSPLPRELHPQREPSLRGMFRIQGSAGITQRTLEGRATTYTGWREQTEQPFEWQGFTLQGGVQHRHGWYALVGIGRTQITERFNMNRTRTEPSEVHFVSEVYIGANGNSTLTWGT